jgi:hypothetical protein
MTPLNEFGIDATNHTLVARQPDRRSEQDWMEDNRSDRGATADQLANYLDRSI